MSSIKSVLANELFLALYLISEIIDGFDKKNPNQIYFVDGCISLNCRYCCSQRSRQAPQ
jgi:hypothetical protein